jgi:hypothetical protein
MISLMKEFQFEEVMNIQEMRKSHSDDDPMRMDELSIWPLRFTVRTEDEFRSWSTGSPAWLC